VASNTYEDWVRRWLARAACGSDEALCAGSNWRRLRRTHKSLPCAIIALGKAKNAKRTLERYLDLFSQDDFIRGLTRPRLATIGICANSLSTCCRTCLHLCVTRDLICTKFHCRGRDSDISLFVCTLRYASCPA